ncbi:hypothetical protein KKB55_22385, partial [Myxococcota bacterium]|nr:hypothetical protein [Myxococcota bacterium]
WVGVGLSGALLAGGVFSYLLARDDYARANDPATHRLEAIDLWDEGDSKASTAYLLWGMGGVGLVGSAAWLYLQGEDQGGVNAFFITQPQGGLMGLSGRF